MKQMRESLVSEMSKMRADIAAEINNLREENAKTFAGLSASIENVRSSTSQTVDRMARSNDLIASGIPFVVGEDLSAYFRTWCLKLGYDEKQLPSVDIRRLSRGPLTAGSVYMVFIQFAFSIQRNEFFSRYIRSRSLCLSDVGFAVKKRVFINENLSPMARELRTKALKLKKDGRIHTVTTKNGIVFIKRDSNGGQEIAVSSESELDLHAKPFPK